MSTLNTLQKMVKACTLLCLIGALFACSAPTTVSEPTAVPATVDEFSPPSADVSTPQAATDEFGPEDEFSPPGADVSASQEIPDESGPYVGPRAIAEGKLIPLQIDLIDTGDGWQEVTLGLGIRNDEHDEFFVSFPGGQSATVTIQEEGRSYEAEILFEPVQDQITLPQRGLYQFPVPSGFTFCGIYTWGRNSGGELEQMVNLLQVKTRIPQNTHLMSLEVAGYPSTDLTSAPDLNQCNNATAAEALPQMSSDLPVNTHRPGPSYFLPSVSSLDRNHPRLAGRFDDELITLLKLNIKNPNQFDELVIDDLKVALIDEDGVIRPVLGGTFPDDPEGCQNLPPAPNPLRVGPSQTATLNLCYSERPQEVAAIVIWSYDHYWYAAARP